MNAIEQFLELLPEFTVRIGRCGIPSTRRVWLTRGGMTHVEIVSDNLFETPEFLARILRADFEKEFAKGNPK